MSRTETIEFSVVPLEQDRPRVVQVIPVVAGRPFPDVVAAFEDEHGYDPAGGYAGIVPGHVDLGPLDLYLLGEGAVFSEHGVIDVLGCGCGEWGCWPLAAVITAHGETVTWSHFSQPHRPDRDYREFGPFTFAAAEYRAAARRAMEVLAAATEV